MYKMYKNKSYFLFIILTFSTLLISACGFHLRGHGENINLNIKYWHLSSTISKNLQKNLVENFKLYKAELETPTNKISSAAQANLEIEEKYQETINTLNSQGQVSEVRLKYTVVFLVRKANEDKVLLVPTTIEQYRDIAMNESAALAKEQEKKKLLKDMEYTAASRILEYIQKIPNDGL